MVDAQIEANAKAHGLSVEEYEAKADSFLESKFGDDYGVISKLEGGYVESWKDKDVADVSSPGHYGQRSATSKTVNGDVSNSVVLTAIADADVGDEIPFNIKSPEYFVCRFSRFDGLGVHTVADQAYLPIGVSCFAIHGEDAPLVRPLVLIGVRPTVAHVVKNEPECACRSGARINSRAEWAVRAPVVVAFC